MTDLSFVRTNRPTYGGFPSYVFSFDASQSNHFSFFMTDNAGTIDQDIIYISATSTTFAFTLGSNSVNGLANYSTFLRTTEGNAAGVQDVFMLGSSSTLTKYWNSFFSSTNIVSLSAGNTTIIEAFFVTNSTSSIIVLMAHTGGNYSLRFYSNATMQG